MAPSSSLELEILMCPYCHHSLTCFTENTLTCSFCQKQYPRCPGGSWDFRQGVHFTEWFTADPDSLTFSCEEAGSVRVVDEYLVPLLHQLGLTSANKILSDGCGIGVDVERLRYHEYDAWGIDPGEGRGHIWQRRSCVEYLVHGSGTNLPFADHTFDFVFSEGVIEHVGLTGDQDVGRQLNHMDIIHSARQQYVSEMLRILRPGGVALIAAPNGWFPVDFFHGGRRYGPLTMIWHWPWQARMNSTWHDVQRYIGDRADVSLEILSLRGFFNTRALAQLPGIWPLVAELVDISFHIIPKKVTSTIGPYFAIAIAKR